MVGYAPLKEAACQIVGPLALRTSLGNAGVKALRASWLRLPAY
jgi:hypothetical protein